MKKVAIVTGSNKGIGFATVRGLAKEFDGDVYLTSRNIERGMQAVKDLENEGLTVHFHQLDIDSPQSNAALAAFIQEKYGGIDVLVNNAGVSFKGSPFGYQAQVNISTNYFSVKNVCQNLFPLLRPGARVVNVSSERGFLGNIKDENLKKKFGDVGNLTYEQLDALMTEFVKAAQDGTHLGKGWPNKTYIVAKVGLSALTRLQQRDMKIEDVAINHVHPGYVNTDLTSHKGHLTIDEGAKSSIFAATLPPQTDLKGQFIWADCSIVDWVNGPLPEA